MITSASYSSRGTLIFRQLMAIWSNTCL
jgi:hypothetical protein